MLSTIQTYTNLTWIANNLQWPEFSHLRHWGGDKLTAISYFSCMKLVLFLFSLKFFPRIQLMLVQHWIIWWLAIEQTISRNLNQRWLICVKRLWSSKVKGIGPNDMHTANTPSQRPHLREQGCLLSREIDIINKDHVSEIKDNLDDFRVTDLCKWGPLLWFSTAWNIFHKQPWIKLAAGLWKNDYLHPHKTVECYHWSIC